MKLASLFILLFFSISITAQNISGQAFYLSKTTMNIDEVGRPGMDESTKKRIAERMKNELEKTYLLTFNNHESIYKEEEKLDTEEVDGRFRMMMSNMTPGNQYKNIETKQLIQEQEFFGKQFLIKDSIPELEWQLEKESKQIGQYVVFKATAVKKIEGNDFRMFRRGRRDNESKKDSISNQNPIKEVIVTAWYTPMIPVKNGPGEYAGLPGLILELNVFRTTILCSKIVLNPKESEEINIPKKGKKVTIEEYNTIVKAKIEEMRENFRGGRGRGGKRF